MRKTVLSILLLLLSAAVQAQQPNPLLPSSAPQPVPNPLLSGPALQPVPNPPPQPQQPGAMPLPEGWGTPNTPPTPAPATSRVNLVGKWTFQGAMQGMPMDGVFIFQPNGQYNQFLRFPQTPQLGNQVVQSWGTYTLQGQTLTLTPVDAQVTNGLQPKQICNMQNGQCAPLDLSPQTEQIQVIDDNTIQTSTAVAKRTP